MKKTWGINTILVGLMLLFSWTVFADQQPKKEAIEAQVALEQILQAMEQTGAKAERLYLHLGTKYRTFNHPEEVKEFAKQLGTELGLTETRDHQLESEFRYKSLHHPVLTELRITMMKSRSNSWDSYLTLKLSAKSTDLEVLKTQHEHVHKVLERSQILPHFNTCVQGNYNVTLENDVQLLKLNKLLDLLGAEVVEQVQDPTVTSVSAYTPQLPSYILTNGRQMNVQAGTHVDQLLGITRITIGTPIITIEY
ncbi:YwmB family TATA-box binding protein [Ammoniphilus sp. CFH 90114]|uniref:YwmB family TATA-box binding protein n=1 Tax=Ammoniphilus sp. CFH 90114 TaxID=2493665 RepID=UPI00100EB247|nr:YwmB family TATA-box binding protein [Ammoniphilus sp. CFH 90114]RXT04380.1 hypothetical protein EIZ39_21125 [Ammoniphilus sp. CFH 90114]